nr:MAG TPA: hypothetical protein [Caudoviricetes sp.]
MYKYARKFVYYAIYETKKWVGFVLIKNVLKKVQ